MGAIAYGWRTSKIQIMTPQQIEYEQHIALNPEDVLTHGNYKRYKPTALASKWKWIDGLSDADRATLKEDARVEREKDRKRNEL